MKISTEQRRHRDGGQITIFVGLALGVFLLAFIGFATDYTNFWLHRQQAQSGADATCQAAATDLYLYAIGQATPTMNFVPVLNGTISCSAAPTAAPCIIASFNGFDTALADNDVKMSFPSGPPGAPPPPDNIAIPYVQVDVTQQVQAYFSRLLTRTNKTPVHAKAVCGLVSTPGPVPIVVLHPTDDTTLHMNGASNSIAIIGGPPQSVQINSSSTTAVTANKRGTIDLTLGGPDKTGSSFGTFGGQASQPTGVELGTTGHWLYPHLPIPDPYASVPAPENPGLPSGASPFTVAFGVDGCPDPHGGGCDEFLPGYYPNGICVKSGGGCGSATHGPHTTAIFQPGLYFLGGDGLKLAAGATVRVTCCGGTADGDGTGGAMFYFSGDQNTSINIDSNAGRSPACDVSLKPNNCVVQYHKDGSTESGVQSRALQCPGGQLPPPEVPATIPGNVLLAPCSGTYGDPSPRHYRGFLYFQDRAVAAGATTGNHPPQWQGGGSTLAAGFMYFHQCRAGDLSGTGTCSDFGTVFQMGGTPGSGSYAVGSLVTDRIYRDGTPNISMILHPDNLFPQLKIVFFE